MYSEAGRPANDGERETDWGRVAATYTGGMAEWFADDSLWEAIDPFEFPDRPEILLGDTLHQFPDIPNTGKAGTGPTLPANTIIAIEPITSTGGSAIREDNDGWTIRTADGSLSAHFEHTVLVTPEGREILA